MSGIKPKHHLLVCMNRRPEGHPKGSCQGNGSATLYEAFAAEMEKRNLFEDVRLTGTFCLGPCDRGPIMVVYPEGVWYGKVTPADVSEILDQHLKGETVERLRIA